MRRFGRLDAGILRCVNQCLARRREVENMDLKYEMWMKVKYVSKKKASFFFWFFLSWYRHDETPVSPRLFSTLKVVALLATLVYQNICLFSRNYAWGDVFYTSGSTTDQAVISPEVSTKWFGCHRKWRLEASQRTTTGGSLIGVRGVGAVGGVLLTQEMDAVSD